MIEQLIAWQRATPGRAWFLTTVDEGLHVKTMHPVSEYAFFECERILTKQEAGERDYEFQGRQDSELRSWLAEINDFTARKGWEAEGPMAELKPLALKGKSIAGMWEHFRSESLTKDVSGDEKLAFYAGAAHFHSTMSEILSTATDMEALAWLEARHQEILELTPDTILGMKHNKPGGLPVQ